MNKYRESYAPNKQQRWMLSTTQLQWSCDKNCSNDRAPIQDPTGQSQELCVKDQLLKFQLDPTVNEVETFILRKVCSAGKWVVPQNEIKKRKGVYTKINSSHISKCSINPWLHWNIKSCTASTSICMISKRRKRKANNFVPHSRKSKKRGRRINLMQKNLL